MSQAASGRMPTLTFGQVLRGTELRPHVLGLSSVARGRIELPTRGFSLTQTNWKQRDDEVPRGETSYGEPTENEPSVPMGHRRSWDLWWD